MKLGLSKCIIECLLTNLISNILDKEKNDLLKKWRGDWGKKKKKDLYN